MTARFILSAFLIITCMSSCSDSEPHDWSDYWGRCIVNTWIDNYENGCGGGNRMFFKPMDDTNLHMWRERSRLELLADGSASFTLASPEDPRWTGSIQVARGTWTFNTDTMILLIVGEDGQILYSFLVEHVGEDFLFLAYNETTSGSLPK